MSLHLTSPIQPAKSAKKYPSKVTVNLALRDGPKRNPRTLLLVGLLAAVCFAAFFKFGIVDLMLRAGNAELAAQQDEQILLDMRAALSDYDSVQEEYDNYRLERSALNGSAVSAMESMSLIEKYLLPASKVETFAVAGDIITVKFGGVALNQISDIYNALRDDPKIDGVEVATASTVGELNRTTTATMTIFLPTAATVPAKGGEAQ